MKFILGIDEEFRLNHSRKGVCIEMPRRQKGGNYERITPVRECVLKFKIVKMKIKRDVVNHSRKGVCIEISHRRRIVPIGA